MHLELRYILLIIAMTLPSSISSSTSTASTSEPHHHASPPSLRMTSLLWTAGLIMSSTISLSSALFIMPRSFSARSTSRGGSDGGGGRREKVNCAMLFETGENDTPNRQCSSHHRHGHSIGTRWNFDSFYERQTQTPTSFSRGRRRQLFGSMDSNCETDKNPLSSNTSSSTNVYNEVVDGNNDPESISELSLPQLLQLLNQWNIRYAPNSTRSQLENLLLRHMDGKETEEGEEAFVSSPLENNYHCANVPIDSQQQRQESTINSFPFSDNGEDQYHDNIDSNEGRNDNVVDAVIVDDYDTTTPFQTSSQGNQRQPRQPSEQYFQNGNGSGERRRRRRRQQRYPNNDDYDSGYFDAMEGQAASRKRNYNLYDDYNDAYDYGDRRYDNGGDEELDVDDDVIDLDNFHPLGRDAYENNYDGQEGDPRYENGMQIFLMGFYEAGKTATQLAVDAVADTINPFSSRSGGDDNGEWYYDESLGRDILDVNVLEESRDYEDRNGYGDRSRRRVVPSRRYGRRRNRNRYSSSRRRSYYGDGLDSYYNQRETPYKDSTGRRPRQRRSSPKNRVYTNEDGSPKPTYGLYSSEGIPEESSQEQQLNLQQQQEQSSQPLHERREWKDRVRHKFDVALGLDTPSSSSSASSQATTYYDSWKTQMEQMDDERKEKLRNKLRDMESSSDYESTPTEIPHDDLSPVSKPKNNRRARMRQIKRGTMPTENKREPSFQSSRNSRLDEKPFWRQGGSLASLLFDNQYRPEQSSTERGKMRLPRRNTLEQLLLSPRGREHTVTSLVVYSTQSVLSAFGLLCRWAGVRGTIPQPIVVTSVFAVVISARRGHRIASLLLSLLALRMVGEFIHGSLYGNEFWDDEYDSVAHVWGKDGNAVNDAQNTERTRK